MSESRRVVGLDLGQRRIGIAVADASGTLATPLCAVTRGNDDDQHWREIVRIVEDAGAGTVVIGMPIGLDGEIGAAAKRARTDGKALVQLLRPKGVRVVYQDERLSTLTADRSLGEAGKKARQRKSVIDQAAAAVILQTWLDAQGGPRSSRNESQPSHEHLDNSR